MRVKYRQRRDGERWLPGFQEYEDTEEIRTPKSETEFFLNAQREYCMTRSGSSWSRMWEILRDLVGKALTIELKKTGYGMSGEVFADRVDDALVHIMGRYRYEGYTIRYPATQARHAVRFVLYRDKDYERIESRAVELLNEKGCSIQTALLVARDEILGTKKTEGGETLPLDFGDVDGKP